MALQRFTSWTIKRSFSGVLVFKIWEIEADEQSPIGNVVYRDCYILTAEEFRALKTLDVLETPAEQALLKLVNHRVERLVSGHG